MYGPSPYKGTRNIPDSMTTLGQRWFMVVRLAYGWRWETNVGPTLALCQYSDLLHRKKMKFTKLHWANVGFAIHVLMNTYISRFVGLFSSFMLAQRWPNVSKVIMKNFITALAVERWFNVGPMFVMCCLQNLIKLFIVCSVDV